MGAMVEVATVVATVEAVRVVMVEAMVEVKVVVREEETVAAATVQAMMLAVTEGVEKAVVVTEGVEKAVVATAEVAGATVEVDDAAVKVVDRVVGKGRASMVVIVGVAMTATLT